MIGYINTKRIWFHCCNHAARQGGRFLRAPDRPSVATSSSKESPIVLLTAVLPFVLSLTKLSCPEATVDPLYPESVVLLAPVLEGKVVARIVVEGAQNGVNGVKCSVNYVKIDAMQQPRSRSGKNSTSLTIFQLFYS